MKDSTGLVFIKGTSQDILGPVFSLFITHLGCIQRVSLDILDSPTRKRANKPVSTSFSPPLYCCKTSLRGCKSRTPILQRFGARMHSPSFTKTIRNSGDLDATPTRMAPHCYRYCRCIDRDTAYQGGSCKDRMSKAHTRDQAIIYRPDGLK